MRDWSLIQMGRGDRIRTNTDSPCEAAPRPGEALGGAGLVARMPIYTDFSLMDQAEREAAEMLVPERRRQRFVPEVR